MKLARGGLELYVPVIAKLKKQHREEYPAAAIRADRQYYALTFGADVDGGIWTEGQTQWVGFDADDRRIEIRVLSAVNAPIMANQWQKIEQPFMVVNDDDSFVRWVCGGGHALVDGTVLRNHMPSELEERRLVQQGRVGWTAVENLPKTAFKKAPTPKLRMAILKRDGRRCAICGRSPDDHTDVELHVHHVRPFGQYGVTTELNLLTLCHTCHKGLDPHYNWDLYSLVERKLGMGGRSMAAEARNEYLNAVKRYREAIARDMRALAGDRMPLK